MYKLEDNVFEIIKIESIPEQIEQRDEEKTSLSNLILEFFRETDPPFTQIELACNSCRVNDQLHDGMPHFFLLVYLTQVDYCNKDYRKHLLNSRIEALLCVLHRMGYVTQRYGSNPIEASELVPEGLINHPMCIVYSTGEKAEHQLLSIGIPAAFDNLVAMMADIPDSLFSIMLKGDGDHVGVSIQVFAKDMMQASLIYLNLMQGMKATLLPEHMKGEMKEMTDYWSAFRLTPSFPFAIISYAELSNLLQLPFGTRSGIPVTAQQRRLPLFEPGFINGSDVPIGQIVGSVGKTLTLPLQSQVNHMSVLGISGSGKSNFLLHYLNEMYNDYGIPFLVIDPVSTEYRTLKCSLDGGHLNVFTPGSDVSPLEFNLFALNCGNVTVREYKAVLKDYLRNSLQLFSPLDKLIDETVDTIFLEKGWFDVSTRKIRPGRLFTINDFIKTFDRVFARSKFKGRLENIASSGRVRLNALRNYFDTVAPMPLADILSTPTVVELGKLQSAETKSAILLFLLSMVKLYMMETAAQRHKKTGETQVRQPTLILVIDEAHSILEMQEQGEGMNVAQRGVVDTINQLLLEFRKYGLQVVMSDQRVSVLQDVLTNTHVQVVFKQIDPQGKQVAADIISLDEVQMLASQKRGVAFVKHDKLDIPVQVEMPKYDYKTDTSDEYVAAYMQQDFWQKHVELTRPYVECASCLLKDKGCNRKLRSLIGNMAERFLSMCGPHDYIKLREASIKKDNPLVKHILEREGLYNKDHNFVERCLRVHLLHASQIALSYKKVKEPKTGNNTGDTPENK